MKALFRALLSFLLLTSLAPAYAADLYGINDAGIGTDETYRKLLEITRFQNVNPRIKTHLWFDPYTGVDATGRGSYDLPLRSVEKMKSLCLAYTWCTTKGKDRVYSPLTLTMVSGAAATDDYDFVRGETCSYTGAVNCKVLDWDRGLKLLVLARTSAGAEPANTNVVTGASGAVWNVSGAPVNTINFSAGLTVDNNWDTSACQERDRTCILIDSEYPEHPAKIDGNQFGMIGTATIDDCGAFCAGGTNGDNGWLAVQNFLVENIATDAFTVQSGNNAKLLTLRTGVTDVRNGSENRQSGAVFSNNCITSHTFGVMMAIQPRDHSNRVDATGGQGSCIAPTAQSNTRIIGDATFTSTKVAAQVSATLSQTGGDVLLIGPRLVTPDFVDVLVNPAVRTVLRLYDVLLQNTATVGNEIFLQLSSNNGFQTEVQLNGVTAAGRGRFIQMGTFGAGISPWSSVWSIVGRNLLVDDVDMWLYNFTPTAWNFGAVDLEGIYDDQDGTGGDANEWFDGVTNYATKAAFSAVISPQSKLFTKNSADSNGGSAGTQFTDTQTYGCSTVRECYGAARSQDKVFIDLKSPFGADDDDPCIPEDVLGRRICGFILSRFNYGAR